MARPRYCKQCGDQLHHIQVGEWCLDTQACSRRALVYAKAEIAALKQSVKDWKDSWFKGRDLIGWLWWNHPSIKSDTSRAYYQEQLKLMNETK